MAEEEFVYAVKGEGHLITNKPGASAKQKAKELRDAQPFLTRLARVVGVHTDERAYRLGGDGEEEVGRRLAKLDESDWMVLHDIIRDSSGTNVDHIVIGRPGVFSINTKHHPDAQIVVTERGFRINGHAANYLYVARHEAAKVSEALSASSGHPVEVVPMIVVMGAYLEVRSAPPDVVVLRRKDLPKWFRGMPPKIDESHIRELRRVAGLPKTWRPPSVMDQPPAPPPPAPPVEQPLSVNRWSRGRLKRLYVNDPTGKGLGYRDELTGKIHVNDPKDLETVTKVLEGR